MKLMLTLAACVATLTIAGCNTTQTADVAPGAVGKDKAACCEGEKYASEGCCEAKQCEEAAAAMGAVSECSKSECCASKCDGEKADVSPGAVSECSTAKSECSASKSECSASKCDKDDNGDAPRGVCPVTGSCGEK